LKFQTLLKSKIFFFFLRWGIKVLTIYEGKASGIQWSNLFEKSEPSDTLTMGAIWAMFLADMIVYGIITWYIDSINPGKFGVARKWYFLFQVFETFLYFLYFFMHFSLCSFTTFLIIIKCRPATPQPTHLR